MASMADNNASRACLSRRPGRDDGDCEGPADFDVVYRSPSGKEIDRGACCFRHGLAEVDRHYAAAGMATAELVRHDG